jgi:NADH-quinone oxidoreductase subunit L
MTSFYSWRLMFMTFWGTPRGDKHTHEHAHESPDDDARCRWRAGVGAVFAGMIWYAPVLRLHRRGERVVRRLDLHGRGQHRLRRRALRADLGQGVALRRHAVRAGAGLAVLHPRPDLPGKRLAENQRPLYLFLLNKWYFDEIYDALRAPAPSGWAGSCGRRATAR